MVYFTSNVPVHEKITNYNDSQRSTGLWETALRKILRHKNDFSMMKQPSIISKVNYPTARNLTSSSSLFLFLKIDGVIVHFILSAKNDILSFFKVVIFPQSETMPHIYLIQITV